MAGTLPRRARVTLGRSRRAVRRLPALIRGLVRLPAAERGTTLYALMVLVAIELTIRWVRLPTLSRLLGITLDLGGGPESSGVGPPRLEAPSPRGPTPDEQLSDGVVRARRCTLRLLRAWPFGAGPCLRESLVLGHLIRSRQPVLKLGVARHGAQVRAHAWIELEHQPINDPQGFVAFGSLPPGIGERPER